MLFFIYHQMKSTSQMVRTINVYSAHTHIRTLHSFVIFPISYHVLSLYTKNVRIGCWLAQRKFFFFFSLCDALYFSIHRGEWVRMRVCVWGVDDFDEWYEHGCCFKYIQCMFFRLFSKWDKYIYVYVMCVMCAVCARARSRYMRAFKRTECQ